MSRMSRRDIPVIPLLSGKHGHIGILLFVSESVISGEPFPRDLLSTELQAYFDEIISWLHTFSEKDAREIACATLLDGLMPPMQSLEEYVDE
jgi:hypothetical protein